jgi:predicted phosphohydrolase
MADSHSYHDDLVVPDGDVLVHAGDMTRMGRPEELRAVAEFLGALPHRHKVVIAGNHDWGFAREPEASRRIFAGLTYLEDSEVEIDGLKFWGSPWQPEFFDWAFNLPRGPALAARWAEIPVDTDVLITHGPPRGFGDRTFDGRNEGCDDLLARIREVRPGLHLFGHIHEDRGHWRDGPTLIVNATVAEAMAPVTVLDYEDGAWTPSRN